MLHHFVRGLCFFWVSVVGFACFSLNASTDETLTENRGYFKKELRKAKKELETARDPYHREFLSDHIKGLRALLNALPSGDNKRPIVRRLSPLPPARNLVRRSSPWPSARHLPPDDLRHVLMAIHGHGPYTYNNAHERDGGTTPTRGSPTRDLDVLVDPNRTSVLYTRNRIYAGTHSVSIEQDEDESLLQPNQETDVFINDSSDVA